LSFLYKMKVGWELLVPMSHWCTSHSIRSSRVRSSAADWINPPAEFWSSKKRKRLCSSPIIYQRSILQSELQKMDDWTIQLRLCPMNWLLNQFGTVYIKRIWNWTFSKRNCCKRCCVTIMLKETQKVNLTHLNRISLYNPSQYMILDSSTRKIWR